MKDKKDTNLERPPVLIDFSRPKEKVIQIAANNLSIFLLTDKGRIFTYCSGGWQILSSIPEIIKEIKTYENETN